MAQAALSQILHVMDTLNREELHEVERAVQERLQKQQAALGYSPEEWGALQALLQAGSLLTRLQDVRFS